MTEAANKRPVLITAESQLERLNEQYEFISETLAELRQDLMALHRAVRDGSDGASGEDKKILSNIQYWLRQANQTEAEIDAIRKRNCGIAGGYGLDLEQAALDIGCRLSRLRTCCDAGEVS